MNVTLRDLGDLVFTTIIDMGINGCSLYCNRALNRIEISGINDEFTKIERREILENSTSKKFIKLLKQKLIKGGFKLKG